ncbi:MAG: hypothetical protein WCG06_05435, partial [Candidatus Omnitrophota bacterium]
RKSDNDRAQRQLYEKDLAIYENKTLHPMFDASRIEWRRAIELTLATHLRMRQMAEAAGARYMVFLPDCRLANSAEGQRNVERLFPTLLGRLDYRRPLKIAGKYFTANNVAHLDMTPGFERAAASGKGTLHFEHDGHWNPAGHRLAARLLEEYLLSDPTRVGLSGDGS